MADTIIDHEYRTKGSPFDITVSDVGPESVVATDAPIDDTQSSLITVWSSEKINDEINTRASVAGPQGPQGEKGDTGDTGPTGPAGLDGNDGQMGPTVHRVHKVQQVQTAQYPVLKDHYLTSQEVALSR